MKEIEIKIIVHHEANFEKFNKKELADDIKRKFLDTTGYKIQYLKIKEIQ
jgi:hypothetical protein